MNTTSHPPKKTAIENQGAEGCRAAANWSALPSATPPTWETVERNLGTALERCENDKDHATDGARERINQQSPSDMSEVIQIPKDGSQAPSGRVHPLVLRRWYFSVEDFDDNLEYLGPEGESIDEDEAKRHPFVGDTRAAEDEGERRANRWEERNNACAANVTRHSMGKTQNDLDQATASDTHR